MIDAKGSNKIMKKKKTTRKKKKAAPKAEPKVTSETSELGSVSTTSPETTSPETTSPEVKILGPSVGYTDLLDHSITEKLKEDKEKIKSGERRSNPLRPSSAGKCSRALACELMTYRGHAYYDKPIYEPSVHRLLDLGHAIEFHALRQFRLVKVFEQRYKQQVVSLFEIERGDPSLSKEIVEGSCDYVLYNEHYKCIGDVKSKKERFSYAYRSSWDEDIEKIAAMKTVTPITETALWINDLEAFLEELGEDFMASNFYQLNLYANTEFMQSRGIDHAMLYYYSKNTSRHFELRFKPCVKTFQKIKDKFNKVSKMVDQKKIPEACDFTPGTMLYAFCDCHEMLTPGDKDPRALWYANLPKKKWPKDLDRLPPSTQSLIQEWFAIEKASRAKKKLEERVVKELLDQKIDKIRIADGEIFELKFLKTPREHFEMRRTKL
jgi:hypothetical protein